MLFTAKDHPLNPPDTWVVVKVAPRVWHLQTKDGGTLQGGLATKKEGEALRESGFLVDLYERERRWFAGERIPGWRDYADMLMDQRVEVTG